MNPSLTPLYLLMTPVRVGLFVLIGLYAINPALAGAFGGAGFGWMQYAGFELIYEAFVLIRCFLQFIR